MPHPQRAAQEASLKAIKKTKCLMLQRDDYVAMADDFPGESLGCAGSNLPISPFMILTIVLPPIDSALRRH